MAEKKATTKKAPSKKEDTKKVAPVKQEVKKAAAPAATKAAPRARTGQGSQHNPGGRGTHRCIHLPLRYQYRRVDGH